MPESTKHGAAITVEGLTKAYGDDIAVNDVSFAVSGGEFVTLLGPSGSGKTTTLNVLAGFTRPSAGEILMDGRSLAPVPAHKRNIGMIFQNYALFPHMTAVGNVAYPLKQRKVARREIARRVDEALALVGLEGYGSRYPHQLSGGQQQRVAFARGVVFNPRVLLMDEPLGALDRKLRESLQIEIKRMHRELEMTFVYVTHDQDEALALSDHIVVFNKGRIEQIGTPAELYERPATLFVADFVGESNFFHGTVDAASATLETDGLLLRLPDRASTYTGEGVLMVRPQNISLQTMDSPRLENVLAATVLEMVYVGQSIKLVAAIKGDRRVILRARVGRERELAVGDRVEIGWSREESVLFRDGKLVEQRASPAASLASDPRH